MKNETPVRQNGRCLFLYTFVKIILILTYIVNNMFLIKCYFLLILIFA